MTRASRDLPLIFWGLATVVSLAFAVALAQTKAQEIAVGIVGLVVFFLVLSGAFLTLVDARPWLTRLGLERLDMPLICLLTAALLSFGFSVTLWFFVDRAAGVFVGLWVPSILALTAVVQLQRR